MLPRQHQNQAHRLGALRCLAPFRSGSPPDGKGAGGGEGSALSPGPREAVRGGTHPQTTGPGEALLGPGVSQVNLHRGEPGVISTHPQTS